MQFLSLLFPQLWDLCKNRSDTQIGYKLLSPTPLHTNMQLLLKGLEGEGSTQSANRYCIAIGVVTWIEHHHHTGCNADIVCDAQTIERFDMGRCSWLVSWISITRAGHAVRNIESNREITASNFRRLTDIDTSEIPSTPQNGDIEEC